MARQRLELPAAAIAAAYRDGETLRSLAERYGCSQDAIALRLREQRVRPRAPHTRPRDIPGAELARRYLAGERLADLAERYGCSVGTVAARLADLGVERRPGGGNRRADPALRRELERLYSIQRLPIAEIARRLGLTEAAVQSRRRDYGIPARSQRTSEVERERREQERSTPLWLRLRQAA